MKKIDIFYFLPLCHMSSFVLDPLPLVTYQNSDLKLIRNLMWTRGPIFAETSIFLTQNVIPRLYGQLNQNVNCANRTHQSIKIRFLKQYSFEVVTYLFVITLWLKPLPLRHTLLSFGLYPSGATRPFWMAPNQSLWALQKIVLINKTQLNFSRLIAGRSSLES